VSTSWDTQRTARVALVIVVAFVSVWMLWRFLPALAWAGVLAIATWPLRDRLAHWGMERTAIATLLTFILAIVVVLPLIGLGIEAAREGGKIVPWLNDVRQNGLGTPDWLSHLPYVGGTFAAWWQDNLAEPGAARVLFGRAETSGIFNLTRMLGIEVVSHLTILVFTLLTLFFLYRDGPSVQRQAHAITDRLFGPTDWHLGLNAAAAVRSTVNGFVLVGLLEGVLLGIAYVATGLPHAALLALATGALATVPFGASLVFCVCTLVLLAQSQTTAAIALLVFGSLVALVADHFVRPILIGSSIRLPFLWILLGIFGGLETFGLIGLFLGPAILSVLIAMWRESAV
jgi:predicted PurR-regulated permease PerM